MKSAKIWIDDIREPPSDGWWICRSVIAAKTTIRTLEEKDYIIEVISIDHDAGDYAKEGGDYIEILKELERLSHKRVYHNAICDITFRLHSMNPVGVQNMRAIIQRNAWKEIY